MFKRLMRIGTSHVAWMLAAACTFSALIHRFGQPGMDARFSFFALALAGFGVSIVRLAS